MRAKAGLPPNEAPSERRLRAARRRRAPKRWRCARRRAWLHDWLEALPFDRQGAATPDSQQ